MNNNDEGKKAALREETAGYVDRQNGRQNKENKEQFSPGDRAVPGIERPSAPWCVGNRRRTSLCRIGHPELSKRGHGVDE